MKIKIESYYQLLSLAKIALVAIVYFAIARIGFLLANGVPDIQSLMTPAGFALAAIMLFGKRAWLGVALGSMVFNCFFFSSDNPANSLHIILVSVSLTLGTLIQSLLGNFLIEKYIPDSNLFAQTKTVFRFAFITIFISLITATISLLTFYQSGFNPFFTFSNLWNSTWMGDVASILFIAPLVLVWTKKYPGDVAKAKRPEVILVYILIILLGCFIFLDQLPSIIHFRKAYITIPLLLWAVFRFNLREVITAIALASVMAILGTLKRLGPFSLEAPDESFLSAQIYISIISITILSLKASFNELEKSQAELQDANKKLTDIAEERKMMLINKQREVEDYQKRVEGVFNVLLKYSVLNFNEKVILSNKGDEIDAIASGLNTLGEELQFAISAEKKYTEELEELNSLLKDQEQQIEIIFENAPEAVIVMDAEGIIEKWNPTAKEIFGWSADEITGKLFHNYIIPEKFRDAYSKGIVQFINGRKKYFLNKAVEIEVMNKEGNNFFVSLTVSPALVKGKYIFIAFARDVTEAHKAAEKLDHTSYMVNNATDAILASDADYNITFWNKACEKLYGYKEEEVIGKSGMEIIKTEHIFPDTRESVLNRIIEKGEWHGEVLQITKTGKKVPVLTSVTKLYDKTGKMIGFLSVTRDITEIKKAQEKIKLFDYVVDNMPIGLSVFQFDNLEDIKTLKTISVNPAFVKIMGPKSAKVVGKYLIDSTPSSFNSDRPEIYLEVAKTGIAKDLGVVKFESTEILQGGYLSLVVFPLPNNCVGMTIEDVTEKQKIQMALRRSERFLNEVIENIPNMLFIKDAKDLKFVRLNKAGEELLGFSREELIGKNDYDFFEKKEADFFTSKDRKVLESGELLEIPEELIHTKNKGIRVLETKKIPLYNEKGEAKFLLGISNDITERIAMEENLQYKTQELARSNTELEQFAYVASHDLQEPLRMVNSYVQLLANRYKDKLDKDAMDFIGFAVDGSNRMRNLINSLLEYSRINRIKPFELVNLQELLKEVLHDLQQKISENNAIITIGKLPEITADHVLIHQLFLNLIANALKFRGEKNPEIAISATKQKDEYLFSVKDNGIGIQEQYWEKIFVIFQRLHSKDKYPGTGIGLAMCKKIVERHGGKIWVESKADEGSTFYFTLKDNMK